MGRFLFNVSPRETDSNLGSNFTRCKFNGEYARQLGYDKLCPDLDSMWKLHKKRLECSLMRSDFIGPAMSRFAVKILSGE